MRTRYSTSAISHVVSVLGLTCALGSACSSSKGTGGNTATTGTGGNQSGTGGTGANTTRTGTGGSGGGTGRSDSGTGGSTARTGTGGSGGGSQIAGGTGGKQAATGGVGGRVSGQGGRATGGTTAGTSTEAIDAGAGGAGGSTSTGSACSTAPSGAGGGVPIAVKDLPTIKEMPDPLTMKDGTKVTTTDQWQTRRKEMIQILEDYEYGHMPPPPCNVKATTATALQRVSVSGGLKADYRMLHLAFGPGEKLGFDLGIFTPVTTVDAGTAFPTLISLTYAADKSSLADASAALSRGYAVATVPYQQLGADASNWASTGFFPAYPDYDWRDISAWAWGLSRAVDYLVTDPAVSPDKLMITGVSRLAQAVLLAGAFDERIALSAPVAGGAALRYSGKEMGGGLGQGITEIVDQNTYWFGPRFAEFKNQTPKLPCDQHWLPALTAPRLFIMCNSLSDQYGRAYAAAQTYLSAKPVYEFLGANDNLGVNFRSGSHGMTSEDWSAVLDFADQYLLKKGGTRRFDVLPSASQTP